MRNISENSGGVNLRSFTEETVNIDFCTGNPGMVKMLAGGEARDGDIESTSREMGV